MKHQPPKYSDKELLAIFPEAKEIIPQKIKEWEDVLEKEKNKLKNSLIRIYSQRLDGFSTWFGERMVRFFLMPSVLEASSHILRLKRMQSIFKPNKEGLGHWQEKIEIARHYPIAELAGSKLNCRSTGNNLIVLCPFHNEKRPSFYIYPKTNTFYCFGCQEKGDVIKLTMHLHGVNFKEAVQMLQN